MQKNGNIKIYINERKQGLSYAKNIGIEISSGKYITFIDSDDVVSVNYISHLVDILENNNCDISICSTVSNDEDLDKGANEKEFVMNKKVALKEMFYGRKFGVSSWGKMYKIFLFDNIRFPVRLLYEDLLTTHKLIEKTGSIVFSERKLYCYHPFIEGTLSNTPSKNNFEQLVFSSDEVLNYAALNYKEIINSVEIRYINNLLRCLSISFFDPILYSSIKRKIKSCELKGYFFSKSVTSKNKILLLSLLINKRFFYFLNSIYRKSKGKTNICSYSAAIFYSDKMIKYGK